jgi:uracil-DNA glycosylase
VVSPQDAPSAFTTLRADQLGMQATLRNAYLDVLGIDRWVPRNAVEPLADAPAAIAAPRMPPASARGPAMHPAAEPAARAPLEAPAPLPPGIDWGPLRERVAGCTLCDLSKTRTQTVFGVGNIQADWLIIGEAPGA